MELVRSQAGTYIYHQCKTREHKKGAVVFIHGFATTSAYHDGFVAAIQQHYDYYALQLPGHGIEAYDSATKPPITVDFYTTYCVNLIKSLQLEHFYLIGHSMGGGLGIRVANALSSHILGFVAVTPMNSHLPVKTLLNYRTFTPKTPAQTAKLQRRLYHNLERTIGPDNLQDYITNEAEYQRRYRSFFVTLKRSMYSFTNLKKCRINEKRLEVPTLAIAGQFDKMIPYRSVKTTFKKHPEAQFVLFERSGHLPFQEESERYAQVVLDFFASLGIPPK